MGDMGESLGYVCNHENKIPQLTEESTDFIGIYQHLQLNK